MKSPCASILLLGLAVCSQTNAADSPKPNRYVMPLFMFGQFPSLLTQPSSKAELKITKDQEPAMDLAVKKWRVGFGHQFSDISKTTGKKVTLEELEKLNVNDMFELLAKTLNANQMKRMKQVMRQQCGMDIFEHKEIRDALNLKAEDISRLRKIHGDLLKEINGGGKGKYTKEEAGKRMNALLKGVPEKVRAGLSAEQRARLNELIGDQFTP